MDKQEYTLTIYTENSVGLLNRIATIFSKRKISIDSINSSPSEIINISRFTLVIHEHEEVVKKLVKQIEKQVEVLSAFYNNNEDIVWQELALYKVPTDQIIEKVKVERLLREFGARAVAIRKDFTVFETTGHRDETQKLMDKLTEFGLIEFVRTARIAILKSSNKFHSRLTEFSLKPAPELVENEFLNQGNEVFDV
ncbi:MAG: acetolactate synthase small subunit [Alphaproteobacteria bacterium]|nr:acetolactate synthase small subunit [Alphaproteobacteria bacterium]